MRISDWSSDVCSSDLTVPGYIFGAGKNGQIDAMADGPEIERRRPGIVHQRHDSPCLGHRDDRGHILHFEGEASRAFQRSEEHTSELQSLMRISYAVFCLKKKKKNKLNDVLE